MQQSPKFSKHLKLSPKKLPKPKSHHPIKIKPKVAFKTQWKCLTQQDFHNLIKEKPKAFTSIEITDLSTQNSNSTTIRKLLKLLKNNKSLFKLSLKAYYGNTQGLQFFQKHLKYLSHINSLKTDFHTSQSYSLNIYKNLEYLKNISFLEIDHCAVPLINDTRGTLPFSLKNLRNLATFKIKFLNASWIQNSQFSELARILNKNKKFKDFSLDLSKCQDLTSPNIKSILPILQNSSYIFNLSLNMHESHPGHPHNIQESLAILNLAKPKLPFNIKLDFLLFTGSSYYASNDLFKDTLYLNSLDLAFPLAELGAKQIIKSLSLQLSNMISLQKLRPSFLSFGEMTQDLINLFSSFKSLQNLKLLKLDYHQNHKNSEAIESLAESLKSLSSLSSLSLNFSNTGLDDLGIGYFASSFPFLKNLTNLDLDINRCYITSIGLKKLALGLNTLSPSLQALKLSLNTKKKGAEWLCSLCRKRARSNGILLLFSALKDFTSLAKLSIDLSDSKLTEEQIHYLQIALDSMKNLSSFSLKFTYMNSEATQNFFKKLKTITPCHISLSLSLHSACKQEVEQLCISLQKFKSLIDLELNFEKLWKMSSSDARQLGIVLEGLVNLSSLVVKISEMMILTTEGGVQFTTGLRNLKYLSLLHVIFPEITNYQGVNLKLLERPQRHKFLKNLMINYMRIGV